jgi:hypothetical protein
MKLKLMKFQTQKWFQLFLVLTVLMFNVAFVEQAQAQVGSSTNTGSLAFDQTAHQAFLLSNGKVLIMGGQTDNGPMNNSWAGSQIWDPITGNWTIVPMHPIPAYSTELYLTTTVLTNGQLLIVGGSPDCASELFDPVSGTWTNTQPMNTPRFGQTATLLPNGKVLVTGGYNSGFNLLSSVELYDPSTGLWTTNGNLITARGDHSATLLPNGKVLIAGGDLGGSYVTNCELYDPGFGTATPIVLNNAAKLSSGAFQIGFSNAPGASFTALATTNLTLPFSNWTTLGSVTEILSGQYQFTDSQATNSMQRFYRVRSP